MSESPFSLDPEQLIPLRRLLFSTAYKMTGEIAVSEDLVQEVLLPIQLEPESYGHVHNLKSYLTRTLINQTLNYLKRQQREREIYPGPWLPEPVMMQEELTHRLDIDYGMTVLMARLAPRERAVFLLRETFELPHKEIAEWLEDSEEGVRKRYQRAKSRMNARRRLNRIEQAEKEALLDALSKALVEGDFQFLIDRLKADIVLYSDGGGKVAAARNPLVGIEVCLQFLAGILKKNEGRVYFKQGIVNGLPAVSVYSFDQANPDTVVVFDLEEGQVVNLYMIRNPDKLQFFVPKSPLGLSS